MPKPNKRKPTLAGDFFRNRDALLQSLVWMTLSLAAAYPDLCIRFNAGIFSTTDIGQYRENFLIPGLLFLLAFLFDFFCTVRNLEISKKRGQLFKGILALLCTVIFLFIVMTAIPWLEAKIGLFVLMWGVISCIKGLTAMIPGADEVVELRAPSPNI